MKRMKIRSTMVVDVGGLVLVECRDDPDFKVARSCWRDMEEAGEDVPPTFLVEYEDGSRDTVPVDLVAAAMDLLQFAWCTDRRTAWYWSYSCVRARYNPYPYAERT